MKTKINILILAIVSALVFVNTLKNSFMWDDAGLIDMISDEKYQQHLRNPFFFLTLSYWKEYRSFHDVDAYVPVAPMRTLSLAIDYKIWKRNPFGWHLTNMILNTINVLLVYSLALFLFNRLPITDYRLPFFVGLLFATHPMHTESVAWMKNRVDLIASMFFILSLLLFFRVDATFRLGVRGLKSAATIIGSVFFFILALLSKEIAVTLPAILVLYVLCFVQKDIKKKGLILTIPYWVIAFLYVYITQFVVKRGFGIPAAHRIGLDLYSNILLVFKTLAYYIKLLVLPFSFNAERTIEIPKFMIETYTWLSVLVVIGVISLGIYIFYQHKDLMLIPFCIFWFFITISPVSNIIYLAPREIAEQRLYLPSVGFCMLLGWGIFKIFEKLEIHNPIKIPFGVGGLFILMIVVVYSVFTIKRNFDWRDEIIFWTKTTQASPKHPRAWVNLGEAYLIRNELEKAKLNFEKALEVAPGFPLAHRGLGFLYFKMGDAEKAIKHFQQAGDIE